MISPETGALRSHTERHRHVSISKDVAVPSLRGRGKVLSIWGHRMARTAWVCPRYCRQSLLGNGRSSFGLCLGNNVSGSIFNRCFSLRGARYKSRHLFEALFAEILVSANVAEALVTFRNKCALLLIFSTFFSLLQLLFCQNVLWRRVVVTPRDLARRFSGAGKWYLW